MPPPPASDGFDSIPDGVRLKRGSSETSRAQSFTNETTRRPASPPDPFLDRAAYTSAHGPLSARQQVPSASRLPDSDDQDHWYTQYNQARLLISSIHDLWKKESEGLRRRISDLEEKLAKQNTPLAGSAGAESGSAAYGGPCIVKASREKLHSLSNVSHVASIERASSRRGSLERVVEDKQPQSPPSNLGHPNVTISRVAFGDLASIPELENGMNNDDPLSPPPTTKIVTPPNYIAYAGHTPGPAIEAMGNDDLNHNIMRPGQYDGSLADLETRGPRMLPSKGEDSEALETFAERLRSVVTEEECPVPKVLRDETHFGDEAATPDSDGIKTGQPSANTDGETINGVKLKKKPSINFGAPLLQAGKLNLRSPEAKDL